jgi:hypothetical protein
MKESYDRGLATHIGSESCGAAREGGVEAFRSQVGRLWHRTLSRRSQNARLLWARLRRLIDRWLPPARPCHPYPLRRMGVIT